MTTTEFILAAIYFQLIIIWMYIRWIYLKVEYGKIGFDPIAPVNQYGENLTDAIQNSIVRGQHGISTN